MLFAYTSTGDTHEIHCMMHTSAHTLHPVGSTTFRRVVADHRKDSLADIEHHQRALLGHVVAEILERYFQWNFDGFNENKWISLMVYLSITSFANDATPAMGGT